MTLSRYFPLVYWTQTDDDVSLRFTCNSLRNINVEKDCDSIYFTAERVEETENGETKRPVYIELDLFSRVHSEHSELTIQDDKILILKKETSQFWPRLDKSLNKLWLVPVDEIGFFESLHDPPSNPQDQCWEESEPEYKSVYEYEEAHHVSVLNSRDWISRDYIPEGGVYHDEGQIVERDTNGLDWLVGRSLERDHYSGAIEYNDQEGDNYRDIKTIESLITKSGKPTDIFNPFKKRKRTMKFENKPTKSHSGNAASQAADCKKTYMFLYNIMMFIGFLFVFFVLMIEALTRTLSDETIAPICSIVKFLTMIQYIEAIHPLLGLVPGGPMMPLAQTAGRLIVVIFLGEQKIRVDSEPYVLCLILVWSSIEIIRYPMYALNVFKVSASVLKWLRYTLFIPLYPMGGFCETMVLRQAYHFYQRTGQYSLTMPNRLNVSLNLATALVIYVIFLLWPTIYIMMSYMWSQRNKKLMPPKEKQS